MANKTLISVTVAFVAIGLSIKPLLKTIFARQHEVFGFSRGKDPVKPIHGLSSHKPTLVPDTLFCEDIHYHEPSGLIFGVAETSRSSRDDWFPPTATFSNPEKANLGKIFTIDPSTNERIDLTLTDFKGSSFITHGIDLYTPPSDPSTVYIFAVNHVPHPSLLSSPSASFSSSSTPKTSPRIEVFLHKLGTKTASHVRSLNSPFLHTPNDLLALSETEVYWTNDHHYTSGLLRHLEDGLLDLAPWSNMGFLSSPTSKSSAPDSQIALSNIQNPNGLAHGPDDTILLGRAAAGTMHVLQRTSSSPALSIIDTIQVPFTIDNPSYFRDPYAKSTGRDVSGYLLAGMPQAFAFPGGKIATGVWWVSEKKDKVTGERQQRLVWQDDGSVLSTASTAVVVAIDPAGNGGKKEGWLFITGPMAEGVVRTRIEL